MKCKATTLSQAALAIALLILGVAGASAASVPEPAPAAVDAAALTDFPAKPHSGFSIAIVHNGRMTYEKGFGFRDDGTPDRYMPIDHNYYGIAVERGATLRARADTRTIYEVGSVTKQFTASAVLLLAQQHQLGLDDAVGRYLPEFTDPALTIRVLLNQRSGLPDLNTLAFVQRVRPLAKHSDGSIDERRVSREIALLPRTFTAGTQFEYSNSNYFILGMIVERLTHEPLATFLAKNVFAPLGMTRTAFAARAAADDVAAGYRIDKTGVVFRAYPFDLAWVGGAGAITSTVEDIARWDQALLSHTILQPASLGEMWRGRDSGRGQGRYAMGWVEDSLGSHRYLWHNGETGGFHALNVLFPDDNLAFCILANNQDARPEYLVPQMAALYFPIGGLDRVLPHSGVVLVEASLAVGLGALAIAAVAIVALKRFIVAGVVLALIAFVIGFIMPTALGYVLGGLVALVPVAIYLLGARFIPPKPKPARK